jgi:hypothetical protein
VRLRLRAPAPAVRVLAVACTVLACAIALSSCGNTLQEQPIPHNILESLVQAPFPVYWLGDSFDRLAVSEATLDPGGAYSVRYGNCLRGGEGTCVTSILVVSSPDNSFLPGGSTPSTRSSIRGVDAEVAHAGRAIVLPTAGVVVDIYATSARVAAAAARTVVPINEPGSPGAPLPPALPNTGFGEAPLPSQVPAPLRPLG